MSVFPPELYNAATRYYDISDAAWRIKYSEAAVMISIYRIPLRELDEIIDQISIFVLLGCKNGQFDGILPSSIFFSKLVFVAQAIGDMKLYSQNQQGQRFNHWWFNPLKRE